MPKMGRPTKEIDWNSFESLCAIFCTEIEIAERLGCCVDTLARAVKKHYGETFQQVFKKKCSPGKISLRRKQFEMAIKHSNITMLIFLGKQYLGQSDKIETHAEPTDPKIIELYRAALKDPDPPKSD